MAFISMMMVSVLLIALCIVFIIGLLIFIVGLIFLTVYLIKKRRGNKKSKAFFVLAIVMVCMGIPMVGALPVLLAITQSAITPPKTVTIDNIVYRNGFYSGLWPVNLTYKGDYIEVEGNNFRRVDCKQFDWIHSTNGGTTNGMLYCAESQWEQARAYYSDSSNFTYYGVRGLEYGDSNPVTELDPEKFDALLSFTEKKRYVPFGSNKNAETRRLPIPDKTVYPELRFYRESNDGYFTSFKGDSYYIIDGKLLLVIFYDYGYGEYEELVVVDVPAEIGQYFIELFKSSEPIS